MKKLILILVALYAPASLGVFQSSWTDRYRGQFACPALGVWYNYTRHATNTRPVDRESGSIVHTGRVQCGWDYLARFEGGNMTGMRFAWINMSGFAGDIFYSEYASAPPPKPSKPSTWQAVVQVDPVVVGTYGDITVPLIEHETRTYEYATHIQNDSCVTVETLGPVSGVNPLSIRIRGRTPCTFHAVISITATLK